VTPTPTTLPLCSGDCNGDEAVTIDELIKGVNIALGIFSPGECPAFDRNGDGAVRIDELVRAVANALVGCPPSSAVTE
jgi:Ca2+-binding EF-hand superfamily protein